MSSPLRDPVPGFFAKAQPRSVPLAWRNLLANKQRLLRSAAGIGFAVLLMLMQLGFEQAFFDSALRVIRGLDGDILIQSVHKYQFATRDPFPMADLDTARKVTGVASARPFYADWFDLFWKNPIDGKVFLVRAFGFNPDEPVLLFPDINTNREKLKEANTVLVDRRARRFLGMDTAATDTEINGVKVKIVGGFALGPDFVSDGTVTMSDSTFASVLHGAPPAPQCRRDKSPSRRKSNGRSAGIEKGAARDDRGVHKVGTHRIRAQISGRGIIGRADFRDGDNRRVCCRHADFVSNYLYRSCRPAPTICDIKGDRLQNRLSFARCVRASRFQCPGRLDPGITGEYLAISHHWSDSIAAPAHDGENYICEPRTDPGDVH